MPLSEHEQRILEQLEKELRSEDPRLASTMSGRRGSTTTRFVIAVVALAIGLGLLIVAVMTSAIWLGVIGFAVMFLGVTYALSAPKKSGPDLRVVSDSGATKGRAAPRKQSKQQGFMQRMEERWDKRSRGE
ncbi:DUF3040 domain-containing protein [Jonesia quinghaiensis]|uniref:DUF3040 domain-containing protein n=1 Tax=Jonesia quinghaiensis TaxID=262806 RepID=UPI00040DCAE9|nr:DUF3040 domain-containing protein [Jonesia quinghaiensis]